MKPDATVETLLFALDRCFDKRAWHGPHLKAAIRGVDAAQAVWRPQPGRHNIAEQVLHAAYWKYVVRRKLRADKRGSFPLKGSNWYPVRGNLTENQWADMKRLLDEEHRQLRAAIVAAGARRRPPTTAERRQISGIAAHDVYHAGQIRLIRSMYANRGKRR